MANRTIRARLEVEDRFSRPFNRFSNGIQGVGKDTKDAGKSIDKASMSMDGLAGAIVGFVSAYLSMRSLEMLKDLAMLGAEAEAVEDSFTQMGARMGFVASEMTEAMRTSTDNMIDDMTLQRNAMKALIAGIDPQDMLVAMQYVSRYANSVGAEQEQLMTTVMTGLARGSAQFLDDVGIQVMGATDVVGAAITQMEEKMLDFNDNTLSGVRNFEAEVESIKQEIGMELTPVLDELVDAVRPLLPVFSQFAKELARSSIETGILNDALKFTSEVALDVMHGIRGVLLEQNLLSVSTRTIGESVRAMSRDFDSMSTSEITEDLERFNGVLANLDEQAGQIADRIALGGGFGNLPPEVQEQIRQQNISMQEQFVINKELVSVYQEELDLREARARVARDNANANNNEEKSLNELLGKSKEWLNVLGQIRKTEYERIEQAEKDSIKQIAEETFWESVHWINMEIEERQNLASVAIQSASDIMSAFSGAHDARMSQIQDEYDAEAKAINDGNQSRWRKEQAVKKLDKEREKREIEAQKRQVAYTAIIGAANTALAIQKSILVILGVGKDTPGGPLIRAGAMISMAAVTAGYIGQIKAAQSQIPNREHGGAVRRGGLYEVAENGKDELFQSGGKTFLLPSQGGRVVPNNKMGGSANVTVNATFNGGDIATIEQRLPEMIAKGLEMADRQGDIDYSRMPNFSKAVGDVL